MPARPALSPFLGESRAHGAQAGEAAVDDRGRSQPQLPHGRLAPLPFVAVALAHALLIALLLFLAPDLPAPLTPPRPISVSLIAPDIAAAAPQPAPRPAVSQPVSKPRMPTPPLASEGAVATARRTVDAPAPEPAAVSPQPEVSPPPAPVTLAEAAPPAPANVAPPRPADYLNNPKPPYPALSRRLAEEGTVRLNILVNPEGGVARLELITSSGYPRLDRAAMETVQSRWKFEPALQAGKPVSAWVVVPIQFTLRS